MKSLCRSDWGLLGWLPSDRAGKSRPEWLIDLPALFLLAVPVAIAVWALVFFAAAALEFFWKRALAVSCFDGFCLTEDSGAKECAPPKAGKFSLVRARPLVPKGLVFTTTCLGIAVVLLPNDGNSCSLRASMTRAWPEEFDCDTLCEWLRRESDSSYRDECAGRPLGAKWKFNSNRRACFEFCPWTTALWAIRDARKKNKNLSHNSIDNWTIQHLPIKSMSVRKTAEKIFSVQSPSSHK